MAVSKNFILKKVCDEAMIIPLVDGGMDMSKVFNINEIGVIIYEGLENNKTIEQIKDDIISEYDIDEETVLNDINDFIAELKQKGIYND